MQVSSRLGDQLQSDKNFMHGGLQDLARITSGVGKDVHMHMTSPVVQEMIKNIWHGGLQGLARIRGKDLCMST